MVSALPAPKSKAYLFAPALSTFISSGNLLLDGLSFHSPTKGSSAAHKAPAKKHATNNSLKVRFGMESPLNLCVARTLGSEAYYAECSSSSVSSPPRALERARPTPL